jgi:Zn-dependent peptidase ImmA (M78 family)
MVAGSATNGGLIMISIDNLEDKAEQTLRDTDTLRAPVPIHLVAQRLNLGTEALPLGEFSGMMIVRGNRGAIGYNSAHARVRQRFTIAHEVAHYVLHAGVDGKARLFADKHVMFRTDEDASAERNRENVEANRLGSALLMPKGLVLKEISDRDLDLDDDNAINHLAKYFWVSPALIANRLLNLQLLLYPFTS